jgi:hypothetical protein
LEAYPKRFPRTYPLFRASIQQQAIGWQHFLKGRIATSIIDYQEQYYRAREHPTDTGQAWAKKLIQQLWGHFFDIWKFRCDERHRLDTSKVSKQHAHRVHGRVRACYASLPNIPMTIRSLHYFTKPVDAQLDNSTRRLEEWLAHTEPLIQHGLTAMAQQENEYPDIRNYFQPI